MIPNATTYGTIIKGYIEENNVTKALQFLKEMRGRKLSLKDATKSLLISSMSADQLKNLQGWSS